MQGSSRSLYKALSSLFESSGGGNDNLSSEDTSESFRAITLYLEKHNTSQSIKQTSSVHEELLRLYTKYVQESTNIELNILFLEVLQQIAPVLDKDDVRFWLKTYLSPAVDSAGFDLNFVKKAREYIKALAINSMQTDDPILQEERDGIAVMVMEYVLQIYLGGHDKNYEIINLYPTDEEKKSQVFWERIRFIKLNCEDLLYEFALKKTIAYFELLNKYFSNPNERIQIITLLSHVLVSHNSQSYQIVNTNFYSSLLKCLMYDFDKSLVLVALSLLVLLIPQIHRHVADALPDYFTLYMRLASWDYLDHTLPNRVENYSNFLKEEGIKWNQALPEQESQDHPLFQNSKVELDVLYLVTLLYGLFPINFMRFSESPLQYLINHKPKFTNSDFLVKLSRMSEDLDPREVSYPMLVREKTNRFLRSFILHPSIIKGKTSIENELKNPLAWLLEESNGDSLGIEKISLGCLSLNPNIMVSIPDYLTDLNLDTKILGHDSNLSGFVFNGVGGSNENSQPSSQHVSRTSSLGSPLMSFKDSFVKSLLPKEVQNINRKLSVVPTDLYLESSAPRLEIKFKEVAFDKERLKKDDTGLLNIDTNSQLKGPDASATSSPHLIPSALGSTEHLNDLFQTHEKLYVPSVKLRESVNDADQTSTRTSVSTQVNEKHKSELHIQKPVSSPTISLETAVVHQNSLNSSLGSSNSNAIASAMQSKEMKGSEIDFYQRELLLMKNELEFRSYLKHLNKFNYLTAKIKLNRLAKEKELHEFNEMKSNYVSKKEYDSVVESLRLVELEHDQKLSSMHDKDELVLDKLRQVLIEKQKISSQLELKNTELQSKVSDLNYLNKMLSERDFEINQLKTKAAMFENTNRLSTTKPTDNTSSNLLASENSTQQIRCEEGPNAEEQAMHSMKNEILILTECNLDLSKDLTESRALLDSSIKSYESKIDVLRQELGERAKALTLNYEQRIQELTATVRKYEGFLEEKNARIVQISMSQPVAIPTPTPLLSIHSNGNSNENSNNNSSNNNNNYNNRLNTSMSSSRSSSLSPSNVTSPKQQHTSPYLQSPPPQRPSIPPNTQPIIKGRGGYQKRSKKFM
ncbi:uncharacterized protein PRCAT00002757001 [Priceomyces carsonii]|uniref:uncharacterized protein n=1 Tax=Priceomyces carsonii TaxID=28549 RepID=UPI002EDB81D0|nr:unnamed protein product [Priceomyces carsonii]